jgi:hypothetical protein
MADLKELADKTSDPIHFEFGENEKGQYVRTSVPSDVAGEFRADKKQNMEFFRRLGELIADADMEAHNEEYADRQVEGSLFEAIKDRKEGQQDVA